MPADNTCCALRQTFLNFLRCWTLTLLLSRNGIRSLLSPGLRGARSGLRSLHRRKGSPKDLSRTGATAPTVEHLTPGNARSELKRKTRWHASLFDCFAPPFFFYTFFYFPPLKFIPLLSGFCTCAQADFQGTVEPPCLYVCTHQQTIWSSTTT